MEHFDGKTAVITGAASGIGKGLADHALSLGMTVIASDISQDALETAFAGQDKAILHACDVSDPDQVAALADAAFDHGPVDLLFNNAGVMKTGMVWEHPLDDWRWMLGVNLYGVIHGLHFFLPRMMAQATPGHVVNTGSIAGLTATPSSSIYVTSKQGVVGLSETLLYELTAVKSKIGVSVLCPGPVKTGIADWDRYGKASDAESAAYGQGRLKAMIAERGMEPAELAAFTFKAIEENRFWVFPHDHFKGAFEARAKSVMNETNPRFRSIIEKDT